MTSGEMHILPADEQQPGILPGGCYPTFPPEKFPPPEPDLDGSDLDAAIDWMTYSHEQLYPMATQGLDLAGANAVAAKWAEIGEQLQEIGRDLERAIARSEHGWTGESAELARQTATKLVKWADDTGARANEASGCVSRQAEIAQRASTEMPEPVQQPEPPPLCGTPDVNVPMGPAAGGGTAAMSASGPFTGGGFDSAAQLGEAPWGTQERARAAHRQAAEVMQRMQRESYEVYGTVPWFTPLQHRDGPKRRPDEDEHERRKRADEPAGPTTRAASSGGAAVGGAAPGGAGGGLGGGGAVASPEGGSRLGAGGQYGVGAGQPGAGAAPAAAAGGGTPRGAGMGGMPMGAMGGAGGGGRSEDADRKAPGFLQGEKGVFEPSDDIHEMLLGGVIDDDEPPQRRR